MMVDIHAGTGSGDRRHFCNNLQTLINYSDIYSRDLCRIFDIHKCGDNLEIKGVVIIFVKL